ncbi:MAG: hypothetical protein J4A00_09120 [Gammaproteobacteria bacterium]|nr:hypothetical protein [Gammaproteobacteria bacterium]
MTQYQRPKQFADLQPFAEWAQPDHRSRWNKRLSSSLEELQALYNALLPRMDEIGTYLDGFPLDKLPEAERNLINLGAAFMEAAIAVELFDAPDEADVLPPERMEVHRFSTIG